MQEEMKYKMDIVWFSLLAGSGFGQEMKMVKVENLVWKEHPVFKGA